MVGERAYHLAGIKNTDIDAADLYSCFPSAVQSFAYDLKLENVCPWSVTGSMAFAGGPYNHGALDGVARMVEVLRAGEGMDNRRFGLTSNLSGIFGKQAVAVFSNQPNTCGYCFEDLTEAVKAKDLPVPTTATYIGPAMVIGYTVSYFKDTITHGFVYCDTPDGERAVAKSSDAELLQKMTETEFVGLAVNIEQDRSFTYS
jgi:acetyl-CoA C-acetyltransferase